MVAMKERVRMGEEKKRKVKCRVCSCCCGLVYVQEIKLHFGRNSIGNSFNEFCFVCGQDCL
jgi:hypothetical protein